MTVHAPGGAPPGGGDHRPAAPVTAGTGLPAVPGAERASRCVVRWLPRVRAVAGAGPMSAFAGEPQPVEVHHRGVWWSGELLGWRFEADGRCVARVRCVVDGLRHSAWLDLADLRLPERTTRVSATAIPGLFPHRPAVPRHAAVEPRRGRHRPPDDDTQPHLLIEAFGARPSPAGLALPAPGRRRTPGIPRTGSARSDDRGAARSEPVIHPSGC